ncbi:uncharacterized protein LOC62_01G000893 [Vanrija pseudolonga]|uniref:Glycosyltransferase family 34 protein n=1 Tax=Vanrija pseudolonga TaxID=143232 RepID=A0AAF0Y3F9_9TREE|nr:hypothetical protein LOC62_01G000893 [Vanrija pseudolonga]
MYLTMPPPGLPFHQQQPTRRVLRFLPRVVGWGAVLALLIFVWIAHLRPALHDRAGIRAARELAAILLPATHVPSPRLRILQHTHRAHGGIETASAITHAAYAAAHGYTHEMDTRNYVGDDAGLGERMMNKAHSMARGLESELAKPLGAEWILWSDADTVIVDPAIPAHLLLPPQAEAMLSAAQDHNGMNAGVMLLRVHETSVRALRTVIELYEAHPDPGKRSDQPFWGVMLRSNPDLAAHFYKMPKNWLNAYWLDEVDEGPVLQIHHVNWLKEVPFTPAIRPAVAVAKEARGRARERGESGNGFELMPQWRDAQEAAREWWVSTGGGIDNMRFLDEEDGVYDAAGALVEPFVDR